ncbi:MAG: hypothetical protein O8C56_00455, partial [Candidatus Methanoperedens sp.]|nr:hypothetical protein [Candidatus Methanoperedens sp.]
SDVHHDFGFRPLQVFNISPVYLELPTAFIDVPFVALRAADRQWSSIIDLLGGVISAHHTGNAQLTRTCSMSKKTEKVLTLRLYG